MRGTVQRQTPFAGKQRSVFLHFETALLSMDADYDSKATDWRFQSGGAKMCGGGGEGVCRAWQNCEIIFKVRLAFYASR